MDLISGVLSLAAIITGLLSVASAAVLVIGCAYGEHVRGQEAAQRIAEVVITSGAATVILAATAYLLPHVVVGWQ